MIARQHHDRTFSCGPTDAPWWRLADVDFFLTLVEEMREPLSDFAWVGFKNHGVGFVLLSINPETFAAWRAAWRVEGVFDGHVLDAVYVPIRKLESLSADDTTRQQMERYFFGAVCQAKAYNPMVDMVLTALTPGEEDATCFNEGWLALETLHGVDKAVVEQCKVVDRAVLNKIPGVAAYVRLEAPGEARHEDSVTPFHLMYVEREADDRRLRARQPAMLCFARGSADDLIIDDLVINAPIEGFIYMVRRRDEVKIGKTIDLRQRLKQLQSVFAIEGLVHYILTDNVARAERAIHKWMAPYRTSGEWFRLPPEQEELMRYIVCLYMQPQLNTLYEPPEEGWVSVSYKTASRIAMVKH